MNNILLKNSQTLAGVADHGALTGLADDDHTQYHNDTRGDARYAPVAAGVTNGNSHDHSGGDGAQINHTTLINIGTNTHAQIDTHLAASNPHTGSLGNIVEDTTPQLGGDLDSNDKYIFLNNSPIGDHTGSGFITNDTVGETVVIGELLYLKSDGKYWKTDANLAALMPGVVLAIENISANNSGKLLHLGYFRDDSWTWTIGGVIYAGETPGALTQTIPAATNDQIQRIGYAVTADIIFFNPNSTVIQRG